MGAIYVIQNLANGKVYVGQTVKESYRDRYVCSKPQIHASQRLLHRAVKAHGIDRFRFEDVMTGVPEDQLDAWERFWIKTLRSQETAFGYNLEAGGRTQKSQHPSSNAKRSAAMMGRYTGRKMAPWSPSRRARFLGERHPMYRRETWIHPVHGSFVGSAKELVDAYPNQGLYRSNLSRVANGIRPRSGGWACLHSNLLN